MIRLVNEFGAGRVTDTGTKENSKHHEVHRSFKLSFYQDVKSLVAAVEDLGNPSIIIIIITTTTTITITMTMTITIIIIITLFILVKKNGQSISKG